MNYKEFNKLANGSKVICNQDHWEFKKGEIATVEFQYYGEGFYYRYAKTNDGRNDVLDAFYEFWDSCEVENETN